LNPGGRLQLIASEVLARPPARARFLLFIIIVSWFKFELPMTIKEKNGGSIKKVFVAMDQKYNIFNKGPKQDNILNYRV
jgi:hypothetical protein